MKQLAAVLLGICIIISKAEGQTFFSPLFSIRDSLLFDTRRIVDKIVHSKVDSPLYEDLENTMDTFDEYEEQLFFEISALMHEKAYLPNPHFNDFYSTLIYGVKNEKGFSDQSMKVDNFLEVLNNSIKIYSKKNIINFLKTAKLFFSEGLLYRTTFNSVGIEKCTYIFKYIAPIEDPEIEVDESSIIEKTEKSIIKNPPVENRTIKTIDVLRIEGPYIEFRNISRFTVSSIYDTMHIRETSGKLLLTSNYFVGSGGKTNWSNVGLKEVYCEFDKYVFHILNPKLQADRVKLYYTERFSEEVMGLYEYSAHRDNSSIKAQYPIFISYHNTHQYHFDDKHILLKGGITLRGKKVSSGALNKAPSVLTVKGINSVEFTARSPKGFSITDSLFSSPYTSISIYRLDSITHPSVLFRYDIKTKSLDLVREKKYKNIPFSNPYFKIDMYAENLNWNIAQDDINLEIRNASDKIPFIAESEDFYSEHIFQKLKSIYDFHPLNLLNNYTRTVKKDRFLLSSLVIYFVRIRFKHQHHREKLYSRTYNLLKGAMEYLHLLNFVSYDPSTDMLEIKHKGFLYMNAANRRRKYVNSDNLRITSRIDSIANATIHLDKKEMIIRGIRDFVINDSLNVYVKPQDQEIIIKKNRDIDFNGRIIAGKFVINGRNFHFDYDSFKVDVPDVDSLFFIIPDTTSNEGILEHSNNIINTGGVLYISEPYNKSTTVKSPIYPLLSAKKGGKVIFDKDLLGGSYNNKVYIDIDPFRIDSATIDNSSSVKLKGSFISSNILPDLEGESYQIREDNDLGFEKNTPPEGYPLYVDKGRFYERISMGSNGLRGDGKITYLTGEFRSKDFIFFPDSVLSFKTQGSIPSSDFGSVSYPRVDLKDFKMRWLPYADKMELRSNRVNFHIFSDLYDYAGLLYYTPKGISGKGRLTHNKFITQSSRFYFDKHNFTAGDADFKIHSQSLKPSLLLTEKADIRYDSTQQKIYIANSQKNGFIFPFAHYLSDIKSAEWNLKEKIITFSSPEETRKIMNFTAVSSDKDPLTFTGKSAFYNTEDYTLHVAHVKKIKVANINIFPNTNDLIIRESGEIDEFSDASLQLNAENNHFFLTDGHIRILSNNKFDGEAWYAYLNDVRDTFRIKFSHFETQRVSEFERKQKKKNKNIDISKTFQTIANASIDDTTGYIKILNGVFFKGDIKLIDTRKNLQFKGQVKLTLEREKDYWFSYENSEEEDIVISIDENITDIETKEKLYTGIYLDATEKRVYAAFLESNPEWKNNFAICTPKGHLRFNKVSNMYIVGSPSSEQNIQRNSLAYNYMNKTVRFESLLYLTERENPLYASFSAVGYGNIPSQDFYFNTLVLLQPPMPSKAYAKMSDDFLQKSTIDEIEEIKEIEEIDYEEEISKNSDTLYAKLAQVLPSGAMKKYLEKAKGEYIFPTSFLNKKIALSKVQFKWSDEFKAFYSVGKIELSHILNTTIAGEVEGYIEIPKSSENNAISIFLRSESQEWYFFKVENRKLRGISSNGYFNFISKIRSIDFQEVEGFVTLFRNSYLSVSDPLELKKPEEFKRKTVKSKGKKNLENYEVETEDESEDQEDDGF